VHSTELVLLPFRKFRRPASRCFSLHRVKYTNARHFFSHRLTKIGKLTFGVLVATTDRERETLSSALELSRNAVPSKHCICKHILKARMWDGQLAFTQIPHSILTNISWKLTAGVVKMTYSSLQLNPYILLGSLSLIPTSRASFHNIWLLHRSYSSSPFCYTIRMLFTKARL
jgi:hypothetical protein